MSIRRTCAALLISGSIAALTACQTAPPPPPPLAPAEFRPLGIGAPYLSGDVIGGAKARSAKMRAAKIRPLVAGAAPAYMMNMEAELKRQTAGIGLDVLRVGPAIVIRIPAALTFDTGSSAVKPQFDATLLEIARTVKSRNQTFVDVFAHTDTTGTPVGNQALSDRRAAAVATYLANHGVTKARISSKGVGQSSPLYVPDDTDTKRAANRRVEIRLFPYIG